MKVRAFSLFLAICLLFSLAGCAGKESEPEETGILTGIFRGTEYPLSDGWVMGRYVTPRYDPESGELRCLVQHVHERIEEDGVVSYDLEQSLAVVTPDGMQSAHDTAEFGDVEAGIIGEHEILLVTKSEDGRFSLIKIPGNCTPILSEADITDALGGTGVMVHSAAADGEGNLYVVMDQKIVGLDADCKPFLTVTTAGFLRGLAVTEDGALWVNGDFPEGRGIAEIDRETQNLGEIRPLPDSVKSVAAAGNELYCLADDGVYLLNVPQKGKVTWEKRADFLNSDISTESSPFVMLDADTFLLSEPGADGNYRPVLYRHAEDVDLSAVTTIELAHAYPLPTYIRESVTAFNKANQDKRIVVKDYTDYNTKDDPQGGARQLAFELSTGTARPDIVFGTPNSEAMQVLVRENAFADLNQYLKTDDYLNEDNLFGCVKTTYSTAKGELFCLPMAFQISTLSSTPEMIGKYAAQKSWTLTDLMDFAESLPEDVFLMEELCREQGARDLLGVLGYSMFIDLEKAECTFDSPEFVRWLNFLDSLPPYVEVWADRDTRMERRLTGKVALARDTWFWLPSYIEQKKLFGTDEVVRIGYPTKYGDGAVLKMDYDADFAFLITSYCPHPDAAWTFIRDSFAMEEGKRSDIRYELGGIPALKSTFDKLAQIEYRTVYAFGYDDSTSIYRYDPDDPVTEDKLKSPGYIARFTETEAEEMKEILDSTGTPLWNVVPAEVSAIIDEEMSFFLGGASSAEDCAKKIQSRVSIWLAEHK